MASKIALEHPSESLLNGVARIFGKNYAGLSAELERAKYPLRRRVASRMAAGGTFALDCIISSGGFIKRATRNSFTNLPKNIKDFFIFLKDDIKENYPYFKKDLKRSIRRWAPIGTAVGGILYGSVKLWEAYGSAPFEYMLKGAVGLASLATIGIAGYETYKLAPKIARGLKKFILNLPEKSIFRRDRNLFLSYLDGFARTSYEGIKNAAVFGKGVFKEGLEKISNARSYIHDASLFVLNRFGLYIDVEEKRKRKREKKKKKITERYKSEIGQDIFLQKIMQKKFINAEHYYSPKIGKDTPSNKERRRRKTKTIGEIFNDKLRGYERNG
jgi:hypothetical protein